MLKKRIIATLTVRDGVVVQSIGFRRYLPIGCPAIAIEFLNQWGIDEIILLDISASRNSRGPDIEMLRKIGKSCLVPLTVGGGISTLSQARELIRNGADKIAFNQAALNNPSLLTEAAEIFGNQCVVGAIDSMQTPFGYRVYDYLTSKTIDKSPGEYASELMSLGAGEIFVNSVDRDGSKSGFDHSLVQEICSAVDVPVICCGGAGVPEHFAAVLSCTGVQAAAAGNFFHFTEHSVTTTKAILQDTITIRHDTLANYADAVFDAAGRLLKKPDRTLEDMRFVRIEKEVI